MHESLDDLSNLLLLFLGHGGGESSLESGSGDGFACWDSLNGLLVSGVDSNGSSNGFLDVLGLVGILKGLDGLISDKSSLVLVSDASQKGSDIDSFESELRHVGLSHLELLGSSELFSWDLSFDVVNVVVRVEGLFFKLMEFVHGGLGEVVHVSLVVLSGFLSSSESMLSPSLHDTHIFTSLVLHVVEEVFNFVVFLVS